jgi:hypothetical protein
MMKVEVVRDVKVKEIVDIEFPYYYIDYCEHGIFYGKIEENKHTQIYITDDWRDNEKSYTLEIEPAKASTMGYYFNKEDKSTEAEFLSAKEKMLAALNPI